MAVTRIGGDDAPVFGPEPGNNDWQEAIVYAGQVWHVSDVEIERKTPRRTSTTDEFGREIVSYVIEPPRVKLRLEAYLIGKAVGPEAMPEKEVEKLTRPIRYFDLKE